MNMSLNKHVIVATLVLATIGIMKHVSNPNVGLTRVFVGSYVFMLALSVLDLGGGKVSQLASGLAMVAMVNGILTEVDLSQISTLAQSGGLAGKPPAGNSPGGTGATP